MTNTVGPALSWRLVHDGTDVLMLAEMSGITETIHSVFESPDQRGCIAEANRLGLTAYGEIAELLVMPAVPQSVTMRQARLALLAAGMLPAVEAAIAALPEPDKTAAQITWEFAATVDRWFGMVPALAAALGMTDAQIDTLFIEAAKL